MKACEINARSVEEIQEALKDQKDQYQQMKFNHAVVALKKPIALRNFRKIIARLATVLHEKEILGS